MCSLSGLLMFDQLPKHLVRSINKQNVTRWKNSRRRKLLLALQMFPRLQLVSKRGEVGRSGFSSPMPNVCKVQLAPVLRFFTCCSLLIAFHHIRLQCITAYCARCPFSIPKPFPLIDVLLAANPLQRWDCIACIVSKHCNTSVLPSSDW